MSKTPKTHQPNKPRPNMWSEAPISVKKRSMNNEHRLAEEIGFDVTPGSGNQPWPGGKGDGSHPKFMFELKETQKDRVGVTSKILAKLCREAGAVGKDPALCLSAYGLPEPIPKDWVAVPAPVFAYMLKLLEESDA